jgi:hypothetical protein
MFDDDDDQKPTLTAPCQGMSDNIQAADAALILITSAPFAP